MTQIIHWYSINHYPDSLLFRSPRCSFFQCRGNSNWRDPERALYQYISKKTQLNKWPQPLDSRLNCLLSQEQSSNNIGVLTVTKGYCFLLGCRICIESMLSSVLEMNKYAQRSLRVHVILGRTIRFLRHLGPQSHPRDHYQN